MKSKISFAFTDKLKIISNLKFVEYDNSWLVIDYESPNWIIFNNFDYYIFQQFCNHRSVEEVILDVTNKHKIPLESSKKKVSDVIQKMYTENFIESNPRPKNLEPHFNTLFLYVTYCCNLKCIHCFLNTSDLTKNNDLMFNDFKEIMDIVKESHPYIKEIVFTGGEPLTRKDIFDLASYSKSIGFKNTLFTNGLLVNHKNIEEIQRNFECVQMSIDGTSMEINDNIRGEGTYVKILKALSLLKDYNIHSRLSCTIMPQNYIDFKENALRFFEELKIKVGYFDLNFGLSEKLGRAINSKSYFEENIGDIRNLIFEMNCELIRKGWKYKNSFTKFNKKQRCDYAKDIIIYPNGDYLPCEKSMALGNVKITNLNELIKYAKIKVDYYSVDNLKPCNDCELKFICSGGCLVEKISSFERTGIVACENNHKYQIYKQLIGSEKKSDTNI